VSPAFYGALMSRSGVASKQKTLGTCSALRGTLCREACQYSKYWLHLASRYRRFWLATHARFIMLGALSRNRGPNWWRAVLRTAMSRAIMQ